jgi:hypothetical protein
VTGAADPDDESVCTRLTGSPLYTKVSSCTVSSAAQAQAFLSIAAVLLMAGAFAAEQLL